MKTGIILISHGSKLNSGNDGLFKVADMLRAMNRWDVVEAAFCNWRNRDSLKS